MARIGVPELLIILVVVVLLFGPGRIAKAAGELGQGIRSFKEGISSSEAQASEATEQEDTN